ncbi:Motile Sperm domain containing protein [Trichuris trichiura]|uniref:Major sperm protein n=1 Tax=Trichuris trichiura TaxID=36087 RepID=A0A077ZBD8_TRITR|nr:Motile Sperm domain containing protein [Trichuris trichiura]
MPGKYLKLIISGTYFHQRLKYVTLKNWTADRVGYKVRPTHPNNYTIKPNVGIMGPNESVLIRVLLYRYSEQTFKQKHFLELFASPIENDDISDAEMLKNLEKNKDAPAYVRLPIRFRIGAAEETPESTEENQKVKKLPKSLLSKFGGGNKPSKQEKGKKGIAGDQLGKKASHGKLTIKGGKSYESSSEKEAAQLLPVEEQVAKEVERDKMALDVNDKKEQEDESDASGTKSSNDYFNDILSHPDTLFWLLCVLLLLVLISRN